MVSQPALSRIENSMDKHAIFALKRGWVNQYVNSLSSCTAVTIDIDATDDPAHCKQQLSIFNGFCQFIYNELLCNNCQTRQNI